jgi:hypothetical protein
MTVAPCATIFHFPSCFTNTSVIVRGSISLLFASLKNLLGCGSGLPLYSSIMGANLFMYRSCCATGAYLARLSARPERPRGDDHKSNDECLKCVHSRPPTTNLIWSLIDRAGNASTLSSLAPREYGPTRRQYSAQSASAWRDGPCHRGLLQAFRRSHVGCKQ